MLDIQINTRVADLPSQQQFQHWVDSVFTHEKVSGEVTICIVDKAESRRLNRFYRHKNKSTNVLSFPIAAAMQKLVPQLLGDLVMCAPLIRQEAAAQGKPTFTHWAHLVIHGILHLLAYDHEAAAAALEMESLEIKLLAKLDVANPYAR